MVRFYCKSCEYQGEKPALPPKCPYCGKENTLSSMKTAQDLLDEVEVTEE
jgi:rubrerythrin